MREVPQRDLHVEDSSCAGLHRYRTGVWFRLFLTQSYLPQGLPSIAPCLLGRRRQRADGELASARFNPGVSDSF